MGGCPPHRAVQIPSIVLKGLASKRARTQDYRRPSDQLPLLLHRRTCLLRLPRQQDRPRRRLWMRTTGARSTNPLKTMQMVLARRQERPEQIWPRLCSVGSCPRPLHLLHPLSRRLPQPLHQLHQLHLHHLLRPLLVPRLPPPLLLLPQDRLIEVRFWARSRVDAGCARLRRTIAVQQVLAEP